MNLKLTIKEVIQETADAITIVFERPAGVDFVSGQFLTLINEINGKEERRCYSLCSAPHEQDRLSVSVKRVEGGVVSNYLNDNAGSLGSMDVLAPLGQFTFEPNNSRSKHYVLFAGGSGITPMYSIVKSVLHGEPNSLITLIYANTNEESIIFSEELNRLEASEDRLKIIHILASPSDSWSGRNGRIDANEVVRLTESLSSNQEREFYMCGPQGFMDQVEAGLAKMNVPGNLVHKESFVLATSGGDAAAPTETSDGPVNVKVIYNDEEFTYEVQPGETILDAGLDQDIDLPYSCQSGVCTACRGKCLSGRVDLSEVEGLSEAELNDGYVLPCVGYPLSSDVVIEIG